jgi:PAS domain S-box-containing protein
VPGRWPVTAENEAARRAALAAEVARAAEAVPTAETSVDADVALAAVAAELAGPPTDADPVLSAETILEQVETGVVVVDHYGVMRYANSFAAILFGCPSRQHLIGQHFRTLGFEEDDLSKVKDLERQACRGRDWEGTLSIRRSDGSIVFVRANAVPLRAPTKEVTGTVIMARQAVQLGTGPSVERLGILDRIGERLAGSLELDVTLRRVAETLVPQFADHCLIDLKQTDKQTYKLVRRAAMHAWDWTPPEGTWKSVGEPIIYPRGHFCFQAMDSQDTVLVQDLREEQYPAPTPESLQAGLDVGVTSVIASPLIARGTVLGVLSLALSSLTERETPNYVAYDRDFVAAIASRVAIAIDNAMLFEEERNTARNFQDSLLPNEPPVLDGLEVAYRYVPAKPLETHGQGIQTQVGGDWYDIITLSAGRVGIVIGDVEGRGARAAAIMGQLRSALRAFAQDDKAPAEILRRLDDWCRTLIPPATDEAAESQADSPIVSCTYLVYDPWSRRLTIANAGHLAPLIVADGDVQQMELEHTGVMLGMPKGMPGVPTFREETHELPPGSTLIFYTDGLVDRRHRVDGPGHYDDAEVLDMLRQAIRSVARESVEKIAAAAERAVPGEIDDDMAIVVVRTSPVELQTWDHRFAAEPIRVSEARKLAFETFVEWGMDAEQVDLACLLVSEVVTNVVLHTSGAPSPRHEFALESVGLVALHGNLDDWDDSPYPEDFSGASGQEFMLRIRKGEASIWVEVFDTDLRLPRIRMAGENDEGGRGLYLVDQLAFRWGTRPTTEGKAVWFEMPIKAGTTGV